MATERLPKRQIREILRQKWLLGRSHRQVAESLRIGLGTISLVLEKAKQAGLEWPTVQTLTEEVLEARLYTRPHIVAPETALRPWPDCVYIHRERRPTQPCPRCPRQKLVCGVEFYRGQYTLKANSQGTAPTCGVRPSLAYRRRRPPA